MGYRDAFESFQAKVMSEVEPYARAAYKKARLQEPPAKIEDVVAGIPSATETFRELVHAMKAAGTQTLIIDLRGNTGGNSLMKEILAYFLYGQEALDSLDNGYQIVKYSDLYYSVYASDSLEKVNVERRTALTRSDYDFKEERARNKGPQRGSWLEAVRDSATFMKEYRTGAHLTPVYKPQAVFVLSTPLTYSSGFNMLRDLYALGATVVGTPSAQPGNNFGDSLPFKLKHTGLSAFVSHKQNISFPNDLERGNCLMPHYLLTYEKLSALGFDPNAELLLALDLAAAGRSPNPRP